MGWRTRAAEWLLKGEGKTVAEIAAQNAKKAEPSLFRRGVRKLGILTGLIAAGEVADQVVNDGNLTDKVFKPKQPTREQILAAELDKRLKEKAAEQDAQIKALEDRLSVDPGRATADDLEELKKLKAMKNSDERETALRAFEKKLLERNGGVPEPVTKTAACSKVDDIFTGDNVDGKVCTTTSGRKYFSITPERGFKIPANSVVKLNDDTTPLTTKEVGDGTLEVTGLPTTLKPGDKLKVENDGKVIGTVVVRQGGLDKLSTVRP